MMPCPIPALCSPTTPFTIVLLLPSSPVQSWPGVSCIVLPFPLMLFPILSSAVLYNSLLTWECSSWTLSLTSISSCSASLRLLSDCSSAAVISSFSAIIRLLRRSVIASCSFMSSWLWSASSRWTWVSWDRRKSLGALNPPNKSVWHLCKHLNKPSSESAGSSVVWWPRLPGGWCDPAGSPSHSDPLPSFSSSG